MAPEQSDRSTSVSTATDIWPLGLLAFWLLTGCEFWLGANDEEPSLQQILREVLIDPLPRASQRAGELGRDRLLPTGFDEWFERCVRREPKARFGSVAELLEALATLVPPTESPEPTSLPADPAPPNEAPTALTDNAYASENPDDTFPSDDLAFEDTALLPSSAQPASSAVVRTPTSLGSVTPPPAPR